MSAPTPRPLEVVLRDLHSYFTVKGNARAAEQTFDMMVAAVAAEEVVKSMERGDDEATRFHTEMLNECLESVGTLDFEIDA